MTKRISELLEEMKNKEQSQISNESQEKTVIDEAVPAIIAGGAAAGRVALPAIRNFFSRGASGSSASRGAGPTINATRGPDGIYRTTPQPGRELMQRGSQIQAPDLPSTDSPASTSNTSPLPAPATSPSDAFNRLTPDASAAADVRDRVQRDVERRAEQRRAPEPNVAAAATAPVPEPRPTPPMSAPTPTPKPTPPMSAPTPTPRPTPPMTAPVPEPRPSVSSSETPTPTPRPTPAPTPRPRAAAPRPAAQRQSGSGVMNIGGTEFERRADGSRGMRILDHYENKLNPSLLEAFNKIVTSKRSNLFEKKK